MRSKILAQLATTTESCIRSMCLIVGVQHLLIRAAAHPEPYKHLVEPGHAKFLQRHVKHGCLRLCFALHEQSASTPRQASMPHVYQMLATTCSARSYGYVHAAMDTTPARHHYGIMWPCMHAVCSHPILDAFGEGLEGSHFSVLAIVKA